MNIARQWLYDCLSRHAPAGGRSSTRPLATNKCLRRASLAARLTSDTCQMVTRGMLREARQLMNQAPFRK